jgi:N-acetylglucosaminyldiphosphoundecaprenol N-acetyl-beta-D-mannosaminyltransferase
MKNTSHNFLGYSIFTGRLSELPLEKFKVINTINPHSYYISRSDKTFSESLLNSDLLLPDGQGIVLAAKVLLKKKISRITGSDIHEHMLKKANEMNWTVFYLGSSDNTLSLIEKRLQKEYPSIKFCGFSPPFKEEFDSDDNSKILQQINEAKPDILFIGMTAPKQEKWSYSFKDKLKVKHILSIGAVFDFYAGTVKRPGKVWQKMGLEWLPRLIGEPARLWKRNFVSTPYFLFAIFWEYIKQPFSS